MLSRCCSIPALLLLLLADVAAAQQRIDVGVVLDATGRGQAFRELAIAEVHALTRGEFDVRFSAEYTIETDGSAEGAQKALEILYRSASVDLVIAGGPVASHVVLQAYAEGAPKPTIAPAVLYTDLQDAPLQGESSGVDNLAYIAFPADVAADLKVFSQVAPISHVAFLTSAPLLTAIPGLAPYYERAAAAEQLRASVVPGFQDPDALLATIPSEADAVYLAQPLGLDQAGLRRLAAGLIERRLPSFVAIGTRQVEDGLLVGLHSDEDNLRVARRVALTLQRILLGEPAATIPVFFQRGERLTINTSTANAIGVSPSWSVMTEAELVGEEAQAEGEVLDLVTVARAAVTANPTLAAQQRAVQAGRRQVDEARARLRPQLDLSATGVVIEEDAASVFQAERTADAEASLSQALYVEPAWAAFDAEKKLQRSREAQLQRTRLDIVQEATTAYLNVLRAKTSERVQRQNLELTRSNLELARVRREIGISGPAEVFRWESQIASARIALIDANARRNQSEINLNRVLRRPPEQSFTTRETGLFDVDVITHDRRFIRFIEGKAVFRLFRDFLAEDALRKAPELAALDATIAASERFLLSVERARWLPTLALQGGVRRSLLREGEGSQIPATGGDVTWNVGVAASLPLYSGGAKQAAIARTREELAQLRLQRQAAADGVEARARAAVHAAGASYAAISLAEDAAVAAAQNRELVEDAYGRGVVSILDLLDAQNASVLAEEGASNSVFDFLLDLMEVERALGSYYFFADDEQREAWFQRVNDYVESRM